MNRRSVQEDGGDAVTAHSVSELESHALSLQAIYDDPIRPGMTPLDAGLASIDRDKARNTLAPTLHDGAHGLEPGGPRELRHVGPTVGQIDGGRDVVDGPVGGVGVRRLGRNPVGDTRVAPGTLTRYPSAVSC